MKKIGTELIVGLAVYLANALLGDSLITALNQGKTCITIIFILLQLLMRVSNSLTLLRQ